MADAQLYKNAISGRTTAATTTTATTLYPNCGSGTHKSIIAL